MLSATHRSDPSEGPLLILAILDGILIREALAAIHLDHRPLLPVALGRQQLLGERVEPQGRVGALGRCVAIGHCGNAAVGQSYKW